MSDVKATFGCTKTLKHTNAHAVRGRLTLKQPSERQFRSESFRELKSKSKIYKDTQMKLNETKTQRTKSTNSYIDSYKKDAMLDSPKFKTPAEVLVRQWTFNMISLLLISTICHLLCISSFVNGIMLVIMLSIALLCIVLLIDYIVVPFNRVLKSLETECDVFDKAVELSFDVYVVRGDARSRFAKFRASLMNVK